MAGAGDRNLSFREWGAGTVRRGTEPAAVLPAGGFHGDDLSDFTGLFIATPAYLGGVHADYCGSLLRTFQRLWVTKIRAQSKFFTGASAVQIARGVLTAQFMASGYSHLLFIDADLGWEPAAVGRLLVASEHHDVCCGVYPKKCDPLGFPVNLMNEDGGPVVHPETGYLQLHDACAGFMLIRRRAIEALIAAYPDRKCSFREETGTPPGEGQYEYDLFDFYIDRNCPRRMYLSEDFGFSRLYQRIGGEIWADPKIRLAHHGHKRYEGALMDILVSDGPSRRARLQPDPATDGLSDPLSCTGKANEFQKIHQRLGGRPLSQKRENADPRKCQASDRKYITKIRL